MDVGLGVIVAVLGVAVGILGSHATLGNKITRALTLLDERVIPSLEDLQTRVSGIEAGNFHRHRRATDGP